jgi:hypothetical protein
MADHSTPNLPSRDFEATSRFYKGIGFGETFRDGEWMILKRGGLVLEFFHLPELDPNTSAFSCSLRLDDLDGFYGACRAAGISESACGHPRLHAPAVKPWGTRMGALVDLDGSLIRLVQN